jgi:hypothetical protein
MSHDLTRTPRSTVFEPKIAVYLRLQAAAAGGLTSVLCKCSNQCTEHERELGRAMRTEPPLCKSVSCVHRVSSLDCPLEA